MNTGGARAPAGDAVTWLSPIKPSAPLRDKPGGASPDSFADILSGFATGPDANGGIAGAEPPTPPQTDGPPFAVHRESRRARDGTDAGSAPNADSTTATQGLGAAYLAAFLQPVAIPDPSAVAQDTPAGPTVAAQAVPTDPTPSDIVPPQTWPGAADASAWHRGAAALDVIPATVASAPAVVSVVRQETHFAPVLPKAAPPAGTSATQPADEQSENATAPIAAAVQSLDQDMPASTPDGIGPKRQTSTPGAPASVRTDATESPDPGLPAGPTPGIAADDTGSDTAGSGDQRGAGADTRTVGKRAPDAQAAPDAVSGGRDLAAGLSPIRQIADTITAAVTSNASDGATATGAPPGPPTMNRVLTIQLEPAHLGTVAITMRVAGDRLEVQVEVARGATLDLLTKDQGSLSAALRASGYTVDALTITSANAGGATSGGGQHGSHEPAQQQTPQFGGQSPQPGGSQDQRGRDAHRGARPDDAGSARRSADEAPRSKSAPGNARGDLYV